MRPTLTNAVHNMHYRKASADRKLWRTAGEKLAADIGTALHLATEHYDLEEKKA